MEIDAMPGSLTGGQHALEIEPTVLHGAASRLTRPSVMLTVDPLSGAIVDFKVLISQQRASEDLFRISTGVVSVARDIVVRSISAYCRRGTVRDDTGRFSPALCRQWADLDQYSALQVHLDACDEQLK